MKLPPADFCSLKFIFESRDLCPYERSKGSKPAGQSIWSEEEENWVSSEKAKKLSAFSFLRCSLKAATLSRKEKDVMDGRRADGGREEDGRKTRRRKRMEGSCDAGEERGWRKEWERCGQIDGPGRATSHLEN